MRKYGLENITVKDVSSDPAWNGLSASDGAQFTPAAFSLSQPLTVYVTGEQKQIVGFDVTDPVSVLQKQVVQLQARLDSMEKTPAKHAATAPAKTTKTKSPK
jgi:hypothetical protein